MATRLTELIIDRVDLVDKGANPEAHVTLYKRDCGGRMKSEKTKGEYVPDEEDDDMEKRDNQARDSKIDDIAKRLDEVTAANEAIAKANADLKAENESLAERVAKAEASAASDRDQLAFLKGLRETEEAQGIAKECGMEASDTNVGLIRKMRSALTPEEFDSWKATMVAKRVQVDEALTVSKGHSADAPASGKAWDTISKRADALMEAEKIAKADAVVKVCEADPKLYQQYINERA